MRHKAVLTRVCRIRFSRCGRAFNHLNTVSLGVHAIESLLRRVGVPSDGVDAVYVGFGIIAPGELTAARRMVLASPRPDATPSLTVDLGCRSGMAATGLARRDLLTGGSGQVIAGGTEHPSSTLMRPAAAGPLRPRAPPALSRPAICGDYGQGAAVLVLIDEQVSYITEYPDGQLP